MNIHRAIFLTGLPGSGKSTLGRWLAKTTGRKFLDLDHFIENRYHTPLHTIFAEKGEEHFRTLEARMLREAGLYEDTVIATGGGTPEWPGNMDFMLEQGTVVWLECTDTRLEERLWAGRRKRPATASMKREELPSYIAALHQRRDPFLKRAHLRLDSGDLETVQGCTLTALKLSELLDIPPVNPQKF